MITSVANTVTFRMFLPHAAKVELLGDFTSWRERRVPMTREDCGWWTVTTEVPAGDHLFCYLVDGSIWLADYAAHGVRLSEYGGWVSQLHLVCETANTTELKPTRTTDLVAA